MSTTCQLSPFHIWLLAARPKTLTVSLTPVMVGVALAWFESNVVAWLPALAALLGAVLIQIGTNLHNDAADFARGADGGERLGPARAVASGWLTARQVERAAFVCFALAMLCGAYLAWLGGWPIVVLGLASLLSGWAYTGGPRPLAYTGLGELFVWLFFGLAAVMGSFYLQTFRLDWGVFVAASMVGLLAAAVIVVNNYRDLDGDRAIGKNTMAVRLGRQGSQVEYGLLLFVPYLLLPVLSGLTGVKLGAVLPFLSLPWAMNLLRRFASEPVGPAFNVILAQTAQLQLAFGALLVLGIIL
ncbi:1,4-dihydroxy-2-naphthoate octaprenyltransferase [Sulfurimicrobium lacus]|uniref:1,4-dihydroxy-2-naphthoate octaprenyltransferase n=1 Tax=Sulfurimicrobium lacus TaxID=2715678 RepID=A0A6F8VA95_9PROT|nr:1,4-dihydroxy-2-naphthoate polyprenyltransferase [Sulfurimicrobium lacus]BCB26250.1 1,4-dihydroxy-2-naphthoate octaprenyltransferase [Sulfurimicrobium lacus]